MEEVYLLIVNENLKIVTIRELLNENLKIPGYQRPYRWSTESAVTLVMDSYGAFANKVSEYRIGSVVLHKTIDYNNKIILNIVDGQQRLTTLSIMFFVFSELIKDAGYENLSKLLDEKYNELSCDAIVNNLDIIRRKVKEFDKNQLKSERVNYGLNMFSLISEMQDPMELDTVVLENVTEEKFKNSKINVRRYSEMYNTMFRKDVK